MLWLASWPKPRVLVEDLRVLYPGFEATEEAAAFVEAAVSGG
jgi:hypothetical protein